MNLVVMSGKIMNKENAITYFPGNETKKSMAIVTLSVVDPMAKKDSNGFAPCTLWTIKMWGNNAEFVHTYMKPGSAMDVQGYLQLQPAGETKDGTPYPAKAVIVADRVTFAPKSNDSGEAKPAADTGTVYAAKATTNLGVKKPASKLSGLFAAK